MGKGKSRSSSQLLLNETLDYNGVIEGLKQVYQNKIRPLEQMYHFEQFHSPCLTDAEITSKPTVLLLGQYSTGKSTFIEYVLGKSYPGCHIGPEPTTDKFVAVMAGEERTIPGNAAAVSPDLPFTALARFGTAFLGKFQVATTNATVLDSVNLIDTPGVLSGEKQRTQRCYDFPGVVEWFADRSDLILLLFDAHKLDISDEFKSAISALKGNDEKIRVVLNKADMVNGQQLMRVYGALMWSLGKVISTPEVVRVYLGSFWDRPLQNRDCEALLKAEQHDLLEDLRSLPKNAAVRKINEIVKRTRMAKVHALIIAHLKQEMPGWFGKSSKQNELITNLGDEFVKLQRMLQLPPGDFPDIEKFKEKLSMFKIDKFPKIDKKLMGMVDDALSQDLPKLMQAFPQLQRQLPVGQRNPFEDVMAGMTGSPTSPLTPLTPPPVEKIWSYDLIDRDEYNRRFLSFNPVEGKLSGAQVRPIMAEFGLDQQTLAKIWRLSDWTQDGYLDADEFIVALWLCEVKKRNWVDEIPETLPEALVPHYRRA
ncbi:hypothetical protein HK102_000172 [Quaeritorhiza haematococci]|nr:hypothetical protein HK102_000172 [Quaeritorhiza haematococci]